MNKTGKTRYMSSMGLAFAEEREMKKLGEMAEQGWLLESFAFLGYRLRKGEAQKLQYNLDVHELKPSEQNEYFEMFEAGGWSHVCSQGNLHIFSAPPGTVPIYSDKNTMYEKYNREIGVWRMLAAVFVIFSIVFHLIYRQIVEAQGITLLSNVFLVLATLCFALAVPSLMTFTAFLVRRRRFR